MVLRTGSESHYINYPTNFFQPFLGIVFSLSQSLGYEKMFCLIFSNSQVNIHPNIIQPIVQENIKKISHINNVHLDITSKFHKNIPSGFREMTT